MIASQPLIDALRRAASRIESPEYNWNCTTECNCGLLAQELCGVDRNGLAALLLRSGGCNGSWTLRVDTACARTGLPLPLILAMLNENGVEPDDIEAIEFAGVPPLQRERTYDFSEPKYVAAWFRAQADLLAEQLAEQAQPKAPAVCPHVYVMDCCLYCCATKPVEIVKEGV